MMEHEYKDIYKPLDLNARKEEESDYVIICCPKCDSDTPSKNIDLSNKLAKCDNCNAVFSAEKKLLSLTNKIINEEIPKPVGVDIFEYNNEIELTLQQPTSLMYTLILSASPLFMMIFFAMFFDKGIGWAIYPAFASIFAAVFSSIKLIKYKQNKIFVTVNNDNLIIEYRPTNLVKDQIYDSQNIDQIFVSKDAHGIFLGMLVTEENGQKAQKLIGRLTDITKAKYLEQEIERYLGIKNKKVTGEL